ncbi:MAG: type VI secretion system contractile sheath large subunit [Planctomycetes bacterium]|nr:type VI secretion system contractile sheath large subunit [Planctomycetota bacterium]
MKPLRVGVIGHFSGRAFVCGDRFAAVDRDSLEAWLGGLGAAAPVGLPFCNQLPLGGLDSLEPDSIAERVPSLAALLEARAHVDDLPTLRQLLASAAAEGAVSEPNAAPAAPDAETTLSLGAILAKSTPKREDDLERLLREAVEPHLDRRDHAALDARRLSVDRVLNDRLRQILQSPAWRGLESRWRALAALAQEAERSETLAILALDVDVAALGHEDGRAQVEPRLRAALAESIRRAGAVPFDLLIVDFELGLAQIEAAPFLADLARALAVPVAVGADGSLWRRALESDARFTELWKAVCALPGADRLALVAPRVLLRSPYGAKATRTERFPFEEIPENASEAGVRERLCWGTGSALLGRVIARSLATDSRAPLESLPIFSAHVDGEWTQFGPTDSLLTDSAAERLLEAGFCWAWGAAHGDAVAVPRIQSITRRQLV